MSEINYQALRDAAEKATQGEWVAFISPGKYGTYAVHTPGDNHHGDIVDWPGFDEQKNAENNARYIAAFNPEVVQALLDELESAKKRIAELESSTVKAVSKKSQGWARPLMAKKHHYFAEGEVTSICGGWMYFGNEREPDTFESPDDCKKCRRKLNKGGSK